MALAVNIDSPTTGDYVPEENILIVYLSKPAHEGYGISEALEYIYRHYTDYPLEHVDDWVNSAYNRTWYLNDDLETIA